MNDAVSLRAVPYENVLAHDRALAQWMDTLPEELNLDGYQLARSLSSPIPATRRLGVQSTVIRTCFYHIRFTLHRPYTSSVGRMSRTAQSVEAAFNAADQVITLIGHTRADYLANTSLAVPGHLGLSPFHVFSAAMFFCFQLISDPDQPGAATFRANIQKAINIIDQCREVSISHKAYAVLEALAPLYSVEFPRLSMQERDEKKAKVLALVRTLAFPYHDSPRCHFSAESPSALGSLIGSPTSMTGSSPELSTQPPVSSIRNLPSQQLSCLPPYTHPPPPSRSTHESLSPQIPQSESQFVPYNFPQQQMYPQALYPNAARDEDSLWSGSLGFGPGDWISFLDVMQSSE